MCTEVSRCTELVLFSVELHGEPAPPPLYTGGLVCYVIASQPISASLHQPTTVRPIRYVQSRKVTAPRTDEQQKWSYELVAS